METTFKINFLQEKLYQNNLCVPSADNSLINVFLSVTVSPHFVTVFIIVVVFTIIITVITTKNRHTYTHM